MSAPSIKRNLTPTRDPTLIDVLNLFGTDLMLNFNCHHLATIQAFNPADQTVTVTISYRQTFLDYSGITPQTQNVLKQYPTIQDVPIFVIGGGSCRITFPIEVGTQCMLLFNDRDINNWFDGSTTSANQSTRLHSFSDAIALIGPNNQNTKIANYDAVRAIITNGTVKVGFNPQTNKLTLTNGTSLKNILQNLCTQLEDLCSKLEQLKVLPGTFSTAPGGGAVTGVSGIPIPATITDLESIKTNITDISTQIGNLIE